MEITGLIITDGPLHETGTGVKTSESYVGSAAELTSNLSEAGGADGSCQQVATLGCMTSCNTVCLFLYIVG